MPNQGVFEEFRRHLEQTLERHEEDIEKCKAEHVESRIELAKLKIKAAVAGAVAGAVLSVIGALIVKALG